MRACNTTSTVTSEMHDTMHQMRIHQKHQKHNYYNEGKKQGMQEAKQRRKIGWNGCKSCKMQKSSKVILNHSKMSSPKSKLQSDTHVLHFWMQIPNSRKFSVHRLPASCLLVPYFSSPSSCIEVFSPFIL